MNTKLKEENERIQEKRREAAAQAYKNMSAVLKNQSEQDGINAILKFLNIKERVDDSLSLSEQLKYVEEKFFIKTRYVELDEDWYITAVIPMIVKTADGRWCAVIPNTDGTCFYIENGKKKKLTGKNAQQFTNNAMYFYKGMKNDKITMRDLFSFMLKCNSKKDIITVFIASVVTILSGMLLPWANSFIFSRIVPAGELSGLSAASALVFTSIIMAGILRLLQSLILTNSMLRTSTYVQSAVFSRLLTLKAEFFKNVKSGELSRMIMEFSDITQIISVRSITACIGIVLSMVYLVQIYIYAPALFGWVVLSTAILGIILLAEGILSSQWAKEYSRSLSGMAGFCYELFSGIEQVKLNGAEAKMMHRWSKRYLDVSQNEDKPFLVKYADVFYKLISIFTYMFIFLYGVHLTASGYIAFSAAYGAYAAASGGVAVVIQMIARFRSSYTLIKPVLDGECEEYGSEKKKPENLNGEITLSDIEFRYGRDLPYVINGLSAHIGAGESVGIVGTSGCGKSTLIRLLLGFEKAENGSIYIDGFDIRELDLKNYRQKIGVVIQNAGLISGDIYSNITITKPDASMEEVTEAIETAGLTDVINSLPMGIHTPVSQENCTLSGGQRQRLIIARALINKPSILIFDEATSALDNITQAKITESVNKLKCTKIIVAHRLSTIENCDRILVMDKGVIVQSGTFEELKNSDGLLSQFIKRQTAIND